MAKSNSFFNIDMLVLSLLKVSACYGYELVKKIKEVSNNTLDIKEGTLYPVVHNLLKKEYISSRDEIVNKKVRVYYHIDPIGRDYLEKTITDFRKNIKGVFDIIEYGEVEKNE